MSVQSDLIARQLAATPVPKPDAESWCQGCTNQFEAAQRYNGDMACTFGLCGSGGWEVDLYGPELVNAVIDLQLFLNERGDGVGGLVKDGKFGRQTLDALKSHVDDNGDAPPFLNKYHVNGVSKGGQDCPPCGVIEEQPPAQTQPQPQPQKSSGMGLLVAAVGVGVLYWIYARQGK